MCIQCLRRYHDQTFVCSFGCGLSPGCPCGVVVGCQVAAYSWGAEQGYIQLHAGEQGISRFLAVEQPALLVKHAAGADNLMRQAGGSELRQDSERGGDQRGFYPAELRNEHQRE